MADTFPEQQKKQKTHQHTLTTFTFILFFISFLVVFLVFLSTNNTLNLILSPSLNNLLSHSSKDPNFVHNNNIHSSEIPISENLQNYTKFTPEFKDSNFSDNNSSNNVNSEFQGLPNSETPANNPGVVSDFQLQHKDSNFNHTQELPTPEISKIGSEIVPIEKNEEVGFVDEPVVDKGFVKNVKKSCNFYMGKWVKDDGYPIYKPGSCPYVDEAFDCQSNGRLDSEYLKWRWKPDDCDLPRFNATDFLDRLRGKKLMLVGDSVNRNQFESMLCLLREGLDDKSKMSEVHGYKITKGRGYYVFKFADFNCTIEFVRSHFLVKEGTRINGQGNSNPTLSIDKIDKTAGKWKKADILVFNTGHWWTHGKTSRGKNYYKEGDRVYPRFDSVEAYRRAIKTWAEWIDRNMHPERQTVFYRAYSSAHYRGGDWDSGGTCNGEKEPILSGAFLDTYPLKMKIVEEVLQQMKVPVVLLNVTRLTNFRKDGHPSVYGKVRTEGKKVSARKQDCSHWCLPGVPDAWNELIYATLVFQQNGNSQAVDSQIQD